MLSYFRINDPYRLVIIFIALILFRLPFMLSNEWFSVSELQWMVIGEKVIDGALQYSGVWDSIGLPAVWIYAAIDFIFGRSYLTYQIIALVIFFFQVAFFNFMALKHKMYHENNYLPALFCGLLGISFFDILQLSPALIGLTFILLSINNLLNYIESRNKQDGSLINIGLYIGIAALFYLPYLLFLIVHIASLLFFTTTQQRRYLLLFYGILFPFVLVGLYYAWHGHLGDFLNNYILSLFTTERTVFMDIWQLLKLFGLTIFIYSFASLKILTGYGFNVFQVRIQKIMFLCFLIASLIWVFYADKTGNVLIMFIPWIAFFLCHFFISIRKRLQRELAFFVYFIAIIVIYGGVTFHWFRINDLSEFLVKTNLPDRAVYSDKRIVVFGPDIRPFNFGTLATPYLNWELSKWQLEDLKYYDNLQSINQNFRNDMPDYVIDQVNLAPQLFLKMPLLGAEFDNLGRGIYRRKNLNN